MSGLRTALSPQDLAVLSGPDGEGTATISASPEFAGIDGSNQLLAVAQVVWTVTQFPQIDRVCFSVDGAFVGVPTDTGLSDEPVSRADHRSVAPRPARDGTGTRDRPAGTQAVPADRSPGPAPGDRQAHLQ